MGKGLQDRGLPPQSACHGVPPDAVCAHAPVHRLPWAQQEIESSFHKWHNGRVAEAEAFNSLTKQIGSLMRATQAEHEIVFEEFEEDEAAEAAEAAQQPPVMKPVEVPPPTKPLSPGAISPSARCDLGPGAISPSARCDLGPGAISPSARCDLGPGVKRREEWSGHHSSYQHLQLVAVREGQPHSERGGHPAPKSPHQQRGR
eukprot:jgi/Chrpa1/21517/Chrysochromulina_OHIO_Genome00009907-RA